MIDSNDLAPNAGRTTAHSGKHEKGCERVGFVGLGDMGGPIARRIAEEGFPLTVWSRRSNSLGALDPGTFTAADSLRQLGQSADIIGVCVFGDSDLQEVVLPPNGLLATMAPNSILVIHSTVSVAVCHEVAAAATLRGVHVLDAPVSGAREGAKRGRLTIMIGGDRDILGRVIPVFEAYGSVIRWMGPTGAGQRMKVLNNVLSFGNGRLASVAIETGERLGLDVESVVDVLSSGSASSFALRSLVEKLMPDPGFADHASAMVEKDTRIFQEMCRHAGVPVTALEDLAVERIDNMTPHLGVNSSEAQA
ncbi:NAD(P)-dependent oxidoreductase [Rhodococcus wratislaviensis]|uniref:Putative oxidoreductase n=1 Tax=Rhodococcus wratislaviensis NBRC 100605 TaxID=1219028 RepID=X0PM70_RHOWR|nr:NAD(P)-dependent oxidoreductase [Rhodococcus wratislaviensis]GAF43629.1 putative oxidoreductase [Rhodococcus wratislaviensis NBRC 100605]